MGGVVTTITYIRGYGTTIIIDNGEDFIQYTAMLLIYKPVLIIKFELEM